MKQSPKCLWIALNVVVWTIIVVMCASCGLDPDCDARTPGGLCVTWESNMVDLHQIDAALMISWDAMREGYGWSREEFSRHVLGNQDISINFHDDYLDCWGGGTCSGLTFIERREIHIVVFDQFGCLAGTSLVHELFHLVPSMLKESSDGDHSEDFRWRKLVPMVQDTLREYACEVTP